ncbi:hypothetical protein ACHAPT_000179 [Fusarium lateritium]
MNQHAENSLLSPKSKHSGRGARHGSNTTASPVSYHSDPFGSSKLGDFETRDFSYVKPRTPQSETPTRPRGFVTEHPSSPLSNGHGVNLAYPEGANSLGDDRAASEWETVAADDEFEPYPEVTTKAQRRQGKSKFATKTDAIRHPYILNWAPRKQTSEPVSRRDPVRLSPVQPAGEPSPRLRTFHSSSSLYSELDNKENNGHVQALHSDGAEPDTTYCDGERAEDVLQGNHGQDQDALKRASAVTSSSFGDPFHYDGERYSDFLRSSAERDNVDEQVKVPVGRQLQEEQPAPEPIQDRRLGGDIVTLLKDRTQTAGTEADWQTVTTEHPYDSMRQTFHDSIAKGTGSSLADVSDTTERNPLHYEYGSMDKIIQHPPRDVNTGSYRVRNDKRSRLPVLVPEGGGRPGLFAQNATRNLVQSPPRTPASLAGLFRKDGPGQTPKRQSLLLDEDRRDSYQTLGSDAEASGTRTKGESSKAGALGLFSWPRIHKSLGREPPKAPPTILDKPLYKRVTKDESKLKRAPHDAFLTKFPTFHMELVSLPEAAMMQAFKRQRGEEDHTDTGAEFAMKKGHGSIGSPSTSTFPRTPTSVTSPGASLPRPPPARHPHRSNRNDVLRRRESSKAISRMLISSSIILEPPGASEGRPRTNRGWYGGDRQDLTTFHDDVPRLNQGPPSTFGKRSDRGRADGSHFHQSGIELVDFTQGNILRRREQADDAEDKRQKRVFLFIILLTIIFPFIGLLAIYNKFDGMISWATEGEMHTLTRAQRSILKNLVLVLVILYPALISGLVVYYAVQHHQ